MPFNFLVTTLPTYFIPDARMPNGTAMPTTYVEYCKDEETAERIAAKIYNGEIDERGFRKLIRSLYPDVAAVYGWKIAGQKNVV